MLSNLLFIDIYGSFITYPPIFVEFRFVSIVLVLLLGKLGLEISVAAFARAGERLQVRVGPVEGAINNLHL